jgi:oxidase EvaA
VTRERSSVQDTAGAHGGREGHSAPPQALRVRKDDLPARFAASAAVTDIGVDMATAECLDWIAKRALANPCRVRPISFAELAGWHFERGTGNLVHDSGKFFSVEGLHVKVDDGATGEWQQPIIVQPEIGILGLLAKEFGGVLHFLMQVKMEPGNPGLFQLSPTVQATRSNYTKVHNGQSVKYLDRFLTPGRGRILVDVLQSEHGAWFYRKANRNMIVEVFDDVPIDDEFRWLSLGQIGELLRHPNLVNMDTRTVLACAPSLPEERRAVRSDTELLSWFTAERARHDLRSRRIPLAEVTGWHRGGRAIEHDLGRFFRVIAVSVNARNREVAGWTQPLIEPIGLGVAAFVVRRFQGVPHVLVDARVEGGFQNTVELGPTVQCTPELYRDATDRPRFLDVVLSAAGDRVRYDAVHSEEGGRFFRAETRYLVVEADEAQVPAVAPAGYQWVTPGQLSALVKHGNYLNVQARTLLSVLTTRAMDVHYPGPRTRRERTPGR